ncbi:MAG: hypothetical protein ACHQ1D_01470 [Nitrososphaerales archaeon]
MKKFEKYIVNRYTTAYEEMIWYQKGENRIRINFFKNAKIWNISGNIGQKQAMYRDVRTIRTVNKYLNLYLGQPVVYKRFMPC